MRVGWAPQRDMVREIKPQIVHSTLLVLEPKPKPAPPVRKPEPAPPRAEPEPVQPEPVSEKPAPEPDRSAEEAQAREAEKRLRELEAARPVL